MSSSKNIYIGAMSGTSHDAIDVSIIEAEKNIILKSFYSKKLPISIRLRIKKIIESQSISLSELGQLDKKIGNLFGIAINDAIKKAKLKRSRIKSVAISGQTIRHEVANSNPFSMQIGDPNIVATLTGLTTISDFRNMHIDLVAKARLLFRNFITHFFIPGVSQK